MGTCFRTCRAETPHVASTWRTDPNMTISASARALAIEGLGGSACTAARPHAVCCLITGELLA